MMGKSHLITGICALEHVYALNVFAARSDIPACTAVLGHIQSYLGLSGDMAWPSIWAMPVCLGFYFLGVLFPDIDDPKSLLGRIIHVPVEHRTWLHAIYLYLAIAVLGFMYPIFSWMVFGVFVHLFWDSFSACGNCWFYKLFSDYRKYPGGAKVKKGHKLKLYHAGEWSEYVLLFVIVVVTVVSYMLVRR